MSTTSHTIADMPCNCGQDATVYERSETPGGPYARLRCPCGYVTHWWAIGWQSGDLADVRTEALHTAATAIRLIASLPNVKQEARP